MRRIYESQAVSRDDEDPFLPGEREYFQPQAMRSINGSAWSNRLVPHWVRRRAISVSVETPQTVFERGEPIPFRITFDNRFPIPVSIRTQSPIRWQWAIDDIPEAVEASLRDPPDETGALHFKRGERITFQRQWSGRFQVSKREWEAATPGEYTLSVGINVKNPARAGLQDETTIRIEP